MIKAKPTVYRGIQFRSRLEARWASFFDRLDWRYVYEPFDCDGWIPDFLLHLDTALLVEVKPAGSLRELRDHTKKIDASNASHEVLLVGALPLMCSQSWSDSALGLLREGRNWSEAVIFDCDGRGGRKHVFGFCHSEWSFRCRVCGAGDGDHHMSYPSIEPVQSHWAMAGNDVQWNAPA
jgi:hypothetical protein